MILSTQSLDTTDRLACLIAKMAGDLQSAYSTTDPLTTTTRSLTWQRNISGLKLTDIDLTDTSSWMGQKSVTYQGQGMLPDWTSVNTTATLAIPVKYTTTSGVKTANLTQLAILVCLNNANSLESGITQIMEAIAENNNRIDAANKCLNELLKVAANGSGTTSLSSITYYDADGNTKTGTVYNVAVNYLGIPSSSLTSGAVNYEQAQNMISVINNKLDELNTLTQENMISLQAMVNKRDQAYELGSNICKLLNTGFQSIARNI